MKLLIGVFCILSGIVALSTLGRSENSTEVLNEVKTPTLDKRSVPVLVELFTSEGCSSCPRADELLSKLVKTETIPGVEVVALGEHVDYWNHLGWTDPYSQAEFSRRQEDYSEAFDLDTIYTPQMIVDGSEEFVGGDWNRARAAIAKAANVPKARIDLKLTNKADQSQPLNVTIQVTNLPSRTRNDNADLFLAITENNLQTQVSRGENGGRSLRHSAVVRELSVLGSIVSKDAAFATEKPIIVSPDWRRENLRVIAFVQERRTRRVIAIGEIALDTK